MKGRNYPPRGLAALTTFFLVIGSARADTWSDWLDSKTKAASASPTQGASAPQGASTAAQAQATATKSVPKQSESISIDQGSTTLVDQSSGSDLVSTALNLVPVTSSATNGQTPTGTVTASGYALYSLVSQKDPLMPENYNQTRSQWLRSLNITLGREQQSSTTSGSTSSTSSTTMTPAGTVYGIQWTPWNMRDATKISDDNSVMADIAKIATGQAGLKNTFETSLKAAVCPVATDVDCLNVTSTGDIDNKIAKLTPAQRTAVNKIVTDYQAAFKEAAIDQEITKLVTKLKHRPQFAVSFQSVQRSGTSPNDYKGELIYDQGFGANYMFTVNGSYDYSDSSKIGGDLRTARAAFQLSRNILQAAGAHLKSPLQFSLAGAGLWQQGAWHYQAQLQLTVPITTGVTLPLSFGYADQIDVLRQLEKGVYGKFGLAFDLSKIADALKGQK
jgi:hypothetical protein